MVEGTGFENRHIRKGIVSSNLTASAQDCFDYLRPFVQLTFRGDTFN